MLREDFDRWLEEHYTELLAVARRRTNRDTDARDAVHAAVVEVLPHVPGMGAPGTPNAPWTRLVNAIRGEAKDQRKLADRRARVRGAVRAVAKINSPAVPYLGWKRPAPRAD